jgi:hypothetical protein
MLFLIFLILLLLQSSSSFTTVVGKNCETGRAERNLDLGNVDCGVGRGGTSSSTITTGGSLFAKRKEKLMDCNLLKELFFFLISVELILFIKGGADINVII